jgi:hypothetical protein
MNGFLAPAITVGEPAGGFDYTYYSHFTPELNLEATGGPVSVQLDATGILALTGITGVTVTRYAVPVGIMQLLGSAELTVLEPVHLEATGVMQLSGVVTVRTGAIAIDLDATGVMQMLSPVTLSTPAFLDATGVMLLTGQVIGTIDLRATGLMGFTGQANSSIAVFLDASGQLLSWSEAGITRGAALAATGVVQLVAKIVSTGPGSGLIVIESRPGDPLDRLREGDSFYILLPWAGVEGMSGVARVISRKATDQLGRQQLTLRFTRQPDPDTVPGLATGDRPRVLPERDSVGHRLSKLERE